MKPMIVAFDFDDTLSDTGTEKIIKPQKLRQVIANFQKENIHVVIVSARGGRAKMLKQLDDAFGANRSFLLHDDIYDLTKAQEVDPTNTRFQAGCTKADMLNLVLEEYNARHVEKAEKGNVSFTDNDPTHCDTVEVNGYPIFRFRVINDAHGEHPEENFLDNFYEHVTGKKLVSSATSQTFRPGEGENKPLIDREPAPAKDNRSCCPSICAVM